MKKISISNSVVMILMIVVCYACNSSINSKLSEEPNVGVEEIKPKEVTIGKQVWMTENLNVDKFRNGDPIPQAKTDEEWKKAGENGQPAWCYYDNDPKNGEKFGKLYNWHTVNDPRGLAPVGFHVPSYEEWEKLLVYLGSDAGVKMKSKRGWDNYTTSGEITCPNCKNWNNEYRSKVPCHKCKDTRSIAAPVETISGNGSNDSRFYGLPGGDRSIDGYYNAIGYDGYWWGSTENGTFNAFTCDLNNRNGNADWNCHDKGRGFSVRCLRD